jgi:hypothetical protein
LFVVVQAKFYKKLLIKYKCLLFHPYPVIATFRQIGYKTFIIPDFAISAAESLLLSLKPIDVSLIRKGVFDKVCTAIIVYSFAYFCENAHHMRFLPTMYAHTYIFTTQQKKSFELIKKEDEGASSMLRFAGTIVCVLGVHWASSVAATLGAYYILLW